MVRQQIVRMHRHQQPRIRITFRNDPHRSITHSEVIRNVDLFKRRVLSNKLHRKRRWLSLSRNRRRSIPHCPAIIMRSNSMQHMLPRLRPAKSLVPPRRRKRPCQPRMVGMRDQLPAAFRLHPQHRLFTCSFARGLMPVMQRQPLEEHHQKEKTEPQQRRRRNQGKHIPGLHLIIRVNNGITEPTLTHAG